MRALLCPQHFLHYKSVKKNRRSRASNFKVNSPIWPKIELVRDFMPVLVNCKFEEYPIKNEGVIVSTTFATIYVNGRFRWPWKPEYLSNPPQNLGEHYLYHSDASFKICSKLAYWPQRYLSLNHNIFSIISLWENVSTLKGT